MTQLKKQHTQIVINSQHAGHVNIMPVKSPSNHCCDFAATLYYQNVTLHTCCTLGFFPLFAFDGVSAFSSFQSTIQSWLRWSSSKDLWCFL